MAQHVCPMASIVLWCPLCIAPRFIVKGEVGSCTCFQFLGAHLLKLGYEFLLLWGVIQGRVWDCFWASCWWSHMSPPQFPNQSCIILIASQNYKHYQHPMLRNTFHCCDQETHYGWVPVGHCTSERDGEWMSWIAFLSCHELSLWPLT
jgi:hypothetical protein